MRKIEAYVDGWSSASNSLVRGIWWDRKSPRHFRWETVEDRFTFQEKKYVYEYITIMIDHRYTFRKRKYLCEECRDLKEGKESPHPYRLTDET